MNEIANYSAEDIERVINDFYSPTSQLSVSQRQQFNTILENLQSSSLAWKFAWKLLDAKKSPSVQFFGAIALYNKVSQHLSELDENQIQQLFQQLIERLILYVSIQSKQIIIKLIVTFCHLILHMIPEKCNNSITLIINIFTQSANDFLIHHPEKGHLIVLNILTILPEEFSRIRVSKPHRSSIRVELEKEFPTVFSYLHFIVSTYHQRDILTPVFVCLSKWLEFGISILQIETIFDYLFQSLNNPHLFDDVSDCLTTIFTLPDALKYPSTFSRLFPQVFQLETLLDQYLLIGDKAKAECVTRLITQFAENLAQLIVQSSADHFCRLVLKCTNIPGQYPVEETCSELTFAFWHALKEEVLSADQETVLELFRPYFEHLIEVLISKGRLAENEKLFTSEDKDIFRSYRSDIIDTMMCAYNVLGHRTMEVLVNHLLISVEQNQSWQIQESIVQLIGAGSEYIQSDENQTLPRLFSLIPRLNFCNNLIINATLTVLGQFSQWLGNHPDILQTCVHLCINALTNTQLIPSASIALKELIKENRMYMSTYLNEIFPVMKNVLDNVNIHSNDRLRCVSIIGYILSAHPSKIVIEHLNLILVPQVNRLLAYLTETNDNQNALQRKENICASLHFICVLITAIGYSDLESLSQTMPNTSNTSDVLCCVLRDLDPILHMILKQFADDIEITEKICEILSRTVTILGESSSPMLQTFVQLLQDMGPNILHSEFLNFIRNTLLLFSKDADKSVFQLFLAVLQKFGSLFHGDNQWLRDHIDTVEDVANFFGQVIKKLPDVLHHCPDQAFALLIQLMKSGMQLHEQGPLKSISTLTSNFIEYTQSNQQAADLLNQNGLEMVQILLRCIGGGSPCNLMDSLSLPLFTLSRSYIEWATRWVQHCLNDPTFPSSSAQSHHRAAFMKILTAERTSRSNFKDHMNKFSSVCRETTSKENLS